MSLGSGGGRMVDICQPGGVASDHGTSSDVIALGWGAFDPGEPVQPPRTTADTIIARTARLTPPRLRLPTLPGSPPPWSGRAIFILGRLRFSHPGTATSLDQPLRRFSGSAGFSRSYGGVDSWMTATWARLFGSEPCGLPRRSS